MTNDQEPIPAAYQIHHEKSPEMKAIATVRVWVLITAGISTLALVASVLGITGWAQAMHDGHTISFQATQIHGLDQSNTNLAGELSQLSNRLTGMSAQVSAADPASDSSLVTCADLRHMGLTTTTGGSVSSVPGTVDLSRAPVPLPGHCR